MSDFNVSADLGPGTVIVVGPKGRFAFDTKSGELRIQGCMFLGLETGTSIGDAHRAFLDAAYAAYFDDNGEMIP